MFMKNNFMGLDGFVWWFGIVEDRMDPLSLGRCRVRVYGWHNEDKNEIPTNHLPWAHPILPLSGNAAGVAAPQEGAMVFGFFMDGDDAQFPVMLGVVPGLPESRGSNKKGFTDPRTDEQLQQSPGIASSKTYTDTGVQINSETVSRYPNNVNESSVSRLARNENINKTFIDERRKTTIKNDFLSEPPTQYAAKYPYNHVYESESGHIVEFDDTPGAERIQIAHRTGTFQEIYPDGKKVTKVVKENYEIILSDDNVYITGKYNLTVGGDVSIYVGGNLNLKVNGNMTTLVQGTYSVYSSGAMTLKGSKIDLNPPTESPSFGPTLSPSQPVNINK